MICALAGCAAYQVGSPTLYRPDIRSVHVEMFESESYRRFLGQQLTESIAKQIERDTPFQLESPELADSYLRGRIVTEKKKVQVESANDDARALDYEMRIEVTWTDRNGMPLMERQELRIFDDVVFIPEGGQSLSTAQTELLHKFARRITGQMEMPW